eukprot:scaffold2181_cov37-Prasinocladus_malaysianus.AAC.1
MSFSARTIFPALILIGAVATGIMGPSSALAAKSSSESSSSAVPVATMAPQYCLEISSVFPGMAPATWVDGGEAELNLRNTLVEAWTSAGNLIGLDLNENTTTIAG